MSHYTQSQGRRFGQRLIHRLSTESLSNLEAALEDYDYARGATSPFRRTGATRVQRGLRMERQRRGVDA